MAESFTMQVWRKTVAARHGDEAALKWLEETNDKLVSITNKKLDRLEKKGYTGYGYDDIINYASLAHDDDRLKLTSEKIMSPTVLKTQINLAHHFNRLKTSTVAGYRRSLEKRVDTLTRIGVFGMHFEEGEVPYGLPPKSKRKAMNFLNLLGQLNLDKMKDYGESEVIVMGIYDAYERGYSRQRLQQLYDQYADGGKQGMLKFMETIAGRKGQVYEDLVLQRRKYLYRQSVPKNLSDIRLFE